jgi:hypothetical protein
VLFVPGFREDIKSRDYKSTLAAIEGKGYKVEFVPIKRARTTIEDWTKELNKHYSKYDSAVTILDSCWLLLRFNDCIYGSSEQELF